MGRTGKWIRNLLTGKKESRNSSNLRVSVNNGSDQHLPASPMSIPQPTTAKEKQRWSFRRSTATVTGRQELNSVENMDNFENDARKHALALAAATAVAAEAAVAAAKAAAAAIQLTAASCWRSGAVEEAAAVMIQSVFRGYLARKALNALKGLVKLQALVRGHLVRKQATATLRCMQALVTVQARARAQRLHMATEETKYIAQRQSTPRRSIQRNLNQDYDKGLDENIKIVEMDIGGYKNSYSNHTHYSDRTEQQYKISTHSTPIKQEFQHQISPTPSAIMDSSPRTCSNHFEESSFPTALTSSPQCYSSTVSKPQPDSTTLPFPYPRSEYGESLCNECPFYPSYMANTKSSRAKARSHSAPKQRAPDQTFERQTSRRKPSMDGRNVPRAVRMQRSSSHVGSMAQNHHNHWSVKLDRSTVSLQESECGSTSTVLTNANYCRSLVGFDVHGARY